MQLYLEFGYCLQGPVGLSGSVGPQGLNGSAGEPGTPGKDGQPGSNGEKGPVGDPGPSGTPGLPGQRGRNGLQGHLGNNEYDGADGMRGLVIISIHLYLSHICCTPVDRSIYKATSITDPLSPSVNIFMRAWDRKDSLFQSSYINSM